MVILAYIWLFLIISTTLFIIIAGIFENNLEESHPMKKWWIKHIIDLDPYDKSPKDD